MPTARPIIIEKFIDHTDSGVTPVPRCSSAKPDGDAGEGEQQRQPGGDRRAEGEEQQDDGRQAGQQLGLVQGLLVELVEVVPHRPLTGGVGLGTGGQFDAVDGGHQFAGGLGQVGVGSGR